MSIIVTNVVTNYLQVITYMCSVGQRNLIWDTIHGRTQVLFSVSDSLTQAKRTASIVISVACNHTTNNY